MNTAWFEQQVPAGDVLQVGELPTSELGAGKSGLRSPGLATYKKREAVFGYGRPYPVATT